MIFALIFPPAGVVALIIYFRWALREWGQDSE